MAPSKSTADHKNTNTRLLLKGYLPVRVHFPASPADDEQDANGAATTFFYVKEHQHKGSSADNDSTQQQQQQPTLFIANAPSYPLIDTATMLQTLLGPLGNIKRVTVVPHPRATTTTTATATTLSAAQRQEWYFDEIKTDRFAHVVFETHKDLRKCFKALQRIMSSSAGCLTVDAVERQTLADAVRRKVNQKLQKDNNSDSDNESDSDDDNDDNVRNLSGFQSIWHSYRQHQKRHQQREALLEECNAAMQAYEDAEQARLRAISTEPDDDGFVTVTHSTQPAATTELEQTAHNKNRKGRSRKRKKAAGGAAQLDDFYRFQTKAARKQNVQDLRQRFQEDLQRIQNIKERQGGFKPFG